MRVVFSIVSHGQGLLVHELLKSIDEYVRCSCDLEIYVLDNIENILPYSSSKYKLNVVKALNPKGFGANHNKIFEFSRPDYFFILNPDICFCELFDVDQVISKIPEFGLAAPRIVDQLQNCVDNKRADLSIWNLIRRHILKKQDKSFDWLAGMFLIANRYTFSKLNGFDEKYFMYVEDCDLSRRCCLMGGRLSVLGTSVYHAAQRGSRKNIRHLIWHIRSLLRYLIIK